MAADDMAAPSTADVRRSVRRCASYPQPCRARRRSSPAAAPASARVSSPNSRKPDAASPSATSTSARSNALVSRLGAEAGPVSRLRRARHRRASRNARDGGKEWGAIAVLVNNAARDDRHAIEDVTPEYWDERLAVNLRHHFFAAQSVAPGMASRGRRLDYQHGLDLLDARTAGNGRVHDCQGRDQRSDAGSGARARRAQHPRQFRRPRRDSHRAADKLWLTPKLEQRSSTGQCLKFRLTESDVARAALFLASDEARGITGHNLIVDGGLAQTSAG